MGALQIGVEPDAAAMDAAVFPNAGKCSEVHEKHAADEAAAAALDADDDLDMEDMLAEIRAEEEREAREREERAAEERKKEQEEEEEKEEEEEEEEKEEEEEGRTLIYSSSEGDR